MRSVLFGILIAAALTAQAADEFRVATFNIHCGNNNLQDIGRTIIEADADVICIQESTPASEQFLKTQLATIYPHIAFEGYEGQYLEERFGFCSKTPLSDASFAPPVDGLFGTYSVTVKHSGKTIEIVNVHLSPFLIRRDSNAGQAVKAIAAVESIHQKEIASIQDVIPKGVPTLVCGDFNSLSTFVAPTHLTKLGFTDSFASINSNPDSQPTWRWMLGRQPLQLRIDYIYHSNHFQTSSSKTVPTIGSDHSLLVSELLLK